MLAKNKVMTLVIKYIIVKIYLCKFDQFYCLIYYFYCRITLFIE